MKHLTDQELLSAMKENEHRALDALFDRYWQPLYRLARARLQDNDAAQDIVQELFIKLWQRRENLTIDGSLENYLQGAVRLSVISHFRSKKITTVQLDDALERLNMLESSIASMTDYLELEKTLEQTLELMPDMLRKVFELRSQHRSVKEIAGELGLADQTVKNYISEVLRRLRLAVAQKHPEKHLTYLSLLLAMLYK